jgi:hypothetical protein
VYQQLRKKMAPGKKGASTRPRTNRRVRRPAGLLTAAVQPLTMAQMIMQHG